MFDDGSETIEVFKTTAGENLGSALHCLRGEEPLILWIDAVCIDQENDIEKTYQVQLMFQIYKHSAETIVWLGPAGPHTNIAMETMKDIGKDFSKFYFRGFPELTSHAPPFEESVSQEDDKPDLLYVALKRLLNSEDPTDDIGQPLNDFFASMSSHVANAGREETSNVLVGLKDIWNRDWWRRIWVIQEYIAALRIRLFCGSAHVASEDMWLTSNLYRVYTDHYLNHSLDVKDEKCLPVFTVYDPPKIIEFRHDRKAQLSGRPLWSILKRVHGLVQILRPSDRRDNVYSLLGLAADTLGVIPDYTKSLEDVFIETAKAILAGVKGTRVLVCCNLQTSSLNLPSFAIDWSVDQDSPLYSLEHLGIRHLWSTTSNGPVLKDLKMHLTGVRVSRVSGITVSLGDTELRVCKENVKNLKAMLWQQWIKVTYDFLRALPHKIAPPDPFAVVEEMAFTFSHSMGVTNRTELKKAVTTAIEGDFESAIQSWSHPVWLSRIDVFYRYRSPEARLFVTDNGFVGHISSRVQLRDLLVAFYGCNVPFVIREMENRVNKLVGPCVVPRLLRKEFLKSKPSEEKFILV
ncbi:hypothetical protein BDZ45DRAFT_733974 [Acephala macrosclerotiorum]|nr:hypothetical protein BDZ45DRAFT_733974 [Acephala macrosclerotiorum]